MAVAIVRGRKMRNPHFCFTCKDVIDWSEFKVKDLQSNRKRKYYHLHCVPQSIISYNYEMWKLIKESQVE